MAFTLVFDVYGTLIDTQGVVLELQKIVGDKSNEFSTLWRQKQLEYSFRRGLMRQYSDFAVCTRDALEFTTAYLNVQLTEKQKCILLNAYRTLPPFNDVQSTLAQLKLSNYVIYAFSNGKADTVKELLESANIRSEFNGVISVDDVQSFKPDPKVYAHLLNTLNTKAEDVLLVSSNPFDVIGAVSVGIRAAWIQRSNNEIFDPWDIQPTITVSSLAELPDSILEVQAHYEKN